MKTELMNRRSRLLILDFQQALHRMPDFKPALTLAARNRLGSDAALACRILQSFADGHGFLQIAKTMHVSTKRVAAIVHRAHEYFNQHALDARTADEIVRGFLDQPFPRRGRKPIPDKVSQAIRDLAALGRASGKKGFSIRDIAKLTKTHVATVHRILNAG
jgi:hypothetical protein